MRGASVLVMLLILARLASAAPVAERGEAGDRTDQARTLSDVGLAHFKNGEYDLAIEAFRKSYALSPAPALLFDLGQAYRRKGDCAEAATHFRRFEASDAAAARRADVGARIEEMDKCAGRPVETTADRKVEAATPIAPTIASSSAPPALPKTSAILPETLTRPNSVEPDRGKRLRLVGLATVGTGLLALGAGIYATTQVIADREQVTALFRSGGAWDASWDERVARGRRYETLSKVMYGFGGALLGTGIAFLYLGEHTRSSASLEPVMSPGAVGLIWSGAFGTSF